MGARDTTVNGDPNWAARVPTSNVVPGSATISFSKHCGADEYQRGTPSSVERKFETYTHKLKPPTLDKSRGASTRLLDPKELRLFRGVL